MLLIVVLASEGRALAGVGNWSQQSARLLPAGRGELLLFGPSRYAYQERFELGLSLFGVLLFPNLSLKVALPGGERWDLATRHRVFLPDTLLALAQDAPLQTSREWLTVLDSDLLMTRSDRGGWTTYQVGVITAGCAKSPCERSLSLLESASPFLSARAPLRTHFAARAGLVRRQYVGREGGMIEVDARVHVHPLREAWGSAELGVTAGVERRHWLVQLGGRVARTSSGEWGWLPMVELGLALE